MYPTIIIIILILILILAILYFIKISIELVYKKKMHTEVMRINGIASIGFIKFKLAEKYLNRLFKLDKISFSSIDTLINYLKDLSASNIKDKKNKKAVKLLGKKSKIYDFFLKIKYGSGDAFYTAMIFGLLSVTLSALITLMKSSGNSTIEINDIELVPDFIENVFEVDFACIIEVKLGNIITIKTIKR